MREWWAMWVVILLNFNFMKKLNDYNSTAISKEELICLKGGRRRYYIGSTEVTQAQYKAAYFAATDINSAN